jgi:hypothetical protein
MCSGSHVFMLWVGNFMSQFKYPLLHPKIDITCQSLQQRDWTSKEAEWSSSKSLISLENVIFVHGQREIFSWWFFFNKVNDQYKCTCNKVNYECWKNEFNRGAWHNSACTQEWVCSMYTMVENKGTVVYKATAVVQKIILVENSRLDVIPYGFPIN